MDESESGKMDLEKVKQTHSQSVSFLGRYACAQIFSFILRPYDISVLHINKIVVYTDIDHLPLMLSTHISSYY